MLFDFDDKVIIHNRIPYEEILNKIDEKEWENYSYLSIGPPKCFGQYFSDHQPPIKEWFTQGGFAGENILPHEYILEKFKGVEAITSWNLSGAKKETVFIINNLHTVSIHHFHNRFSSRFV